MDQINSNLRRRIQKNVTSNETCPASFSKIRNRTKTIELRLYDGKRRKIQIGDKIVFVNTGNSLETLEAEVIDLYIFDSFKTLYGELPLLECGYDESDVTTASPDDMNVYYTKEAQEKYGVVGIKIKLV